MRLVVGLSAAVVASFAAAPARADDGIVLAWSAPPPCPSAAEVRTRLASRLGPDARVRVEGRVERRDAKHYRLKLAVATPKGRGERELEADTCETLASSAVVVVAMSVSAAQEADAAAPAATAPPAAPVAPAAPPAPSAAAPASPPPREQPAPVQSPSATVRVEAASETGLLPSAAIGAGLAVGYVPLERLRIELGVDGWLAQDGYADAGRSRGASFQLLATQARACFALTRGVVLAPCAGAEVARLAATGFGAAKIFESAAVLGGPEAGATVAVPLGRHVAIRGGAAAFFPMARPAFVVTAAGTVFRPEPVSVRAFLGPEVRF